MLYRFYRLAILLSCCLPLVTIGQRVHKSVFIIADGIPADVTERLYLPHIRAISALGAYKRIHVGGIKGSYSETPTISAPGYNDLLTGTWANKHNVWDNDIPDPDYAYYTIFHFVKMAAPQKKTAIFSTWEDNRTKLVGDRLPATGGFPVDYHFDGYEKDTLHYPHDTASLYLHHIDERVIRDADSMIRKVGPDLSWVYLEYTDDVGHATGTGQAFDQAVGYLDQQVGRIWDAIQYRQQHFNEDWQFILTTDHGRDSINGAEHGGQSERERTTWVVTNTKPLNNYFQTMQPAIVDILPTIAQYLGIAIPAASRHELDGISWIGPVSVAMPRVSRQADSLRITWKALEPGGTVKILVSISNHFKEGGSDQYIPVAEVPLQDEHYSIPVSALPSTMFYKIVIAGKNNEVNQWYLNR
ncbi:MAG TPA: alkaline phosphatase family protein [Chitinophaga sp.]